MWLLSWLKKRLLAILAVLAILLLPIAIYGWWHKLTDGFDVPSISSNLAYRPDWEIAPPTPEEEQEREAIFNQKFHYIGKGSQCWVFASEDGKYVIKFFKHYRLRVADWINSFPMKYLLHSYRERKTEEKAIRLERAFRSYKIAYDKLQPETGVVYVHLNKSHALNKTVEIYDKLGRRFDLDLDSFEFLVQKKGELILPKLTRLMQQGEVDHAKKLITSLVQLLVTRCQKDIRDLDPFLRKNSGFLGDQAVTIDLGQFVPDEHLHEPENTRNEIINISKWIMPWLNQNYPELADHMQSELDKL